MVEDDAALRRLLELELAERGYAVTTVGGALEARAAVDRRPFDLVLTDLMLHDGSGLDVLGHVRQEQPGVPVVFMTGRGTIADCVRAMKLGAFDFLQKPLDDERLVLTVGKAIEAGRLQREAQLFRRARALSGETRAIVGASPVMRDLEDQVGRLAPTDTTVLIIGESGTGKELVARALHEGSPRRDRPFVAIDCGALEGNLLAAELFGHTRGAFTGAVKARPGLFREADGGTILLDEIGELPAPIQAKLLRVLQEGEVRPVGEDQSFKVDVRIIAATHRDLVQMAAQGRFREDLYYRLKVVHLQVPSLRERREDIPLLARHFLAECARRFGIGPFKVTPTLLDRLNGYAWPGNVRELQNAIESAVALSSRHEIDVALLPEPNSQWAAGGDASSEEWRDALSSPDLKQRVERFERTLIVSALESAHGNRSEAARALGVNRVTLLGKLIKYGLDHSDTTLGD